VSYIKVRRLIPIGLLMLSCGLILNNWTHTKYSHFAGGFLIGMAIVFMIAGMVKQRRIT
jgi:hypothetical protein